MKNYNILTNIKKTITNNMIIVSILLALFVAIGLKLQFIQDNNFLGFTTRANDMVYFIFTIGISILIYYTTKIKDKKLWIISGIVGIIFAICYYLGDIQNKYIYGYVPTSKKFMLYSVVKLITYFILFSNCVVLLFNKIPVLTKRLNTKKEFKYFTNNKKSLLLVAVIFFISYLPFFLYYYPGNVNTDSMGSLLQITGISGYTNFQPILYTLLLGGLWNLGKFIFGSSIAGIAVSSVFQMVCTSIVFSIVLYYMAKRKINFKWRVITFLFLLLNPLNGWFVVRCEKGILFHLSVILVIIGIIDIIYEKEKFFDKKWKIACFIGCSLMMVFIRNNGIYCLVLTIPFLILACKKNWKKVATLMATILVITYIIQGPIFKILNIEYSRPGEALTVPMQQYARIVKYDSDRLSDSEKEIIQRYFPVSMEKLANDYVPWKADDTKHNFSADEFVKDKTTFIKQYFKFAFKFPVQTVSALVLNTGNNYSPNFNVWGLTRDYGTETEDGYGTMRRKRR